MLCRRIRRNDNRLYQLPISSIYRIQQIYIKHQKNSNDSHESQLFIDFLIRNVKEKKSEASILFHNIKFNKAMMIYLIKKKKRY